MTPDGDRLIAVGQAHTRALRGLTNQSHNWNLRQVTIDSQRNRLRSMRG